MRRRALLAAILFAPAFVLVGVALHRRPPARCAPTRLQRGVALGLFASDPGWDYGGMLGEIARLGASDVQLDVAWDAGPLPSTTLAPRDGLSPSPATLRRTITQARAAGLRVFLFPIVHVAATRPGDWRGRIAFASDDERDAWWASYGAFLDAMAALAEEAHVERLSVGAELVGLEDDRARWAALIARVRREAGVTGYFELTRDEAPERAALEAAWRARLPALAALAASTRRPLVLTELGYPSQRGANTRPWDEAHKGPIDLEEQRLCYAAALATVADAPFLDGVYFWNWFGVGGPNDDGYTPRGKPAAELLRAWLALSACAR